MSKSLNTKSKPYNMKNVKNYVFYFQKLHVFKYILNTFRICREPVLQDLNHKSKFTCGFINRVLKPVRSTMVLLYYPITFEWASLKIKLKKFKYQRSTPPGVCSVRPGSNNSKRGLARECRR